MTKIERFLINHGLAEMKRYSDRVVQYGFKDEDGFYGNDSVSLFIGHAFELHIGSLYEFSLDPGEPDPVWDETFVENTLALARDHIKWALKFRDELSAIENPWGEEDDEN